MWLTVDAPYVPTRVGRAHVADYFVGGESRALLLL